MNIIDHRPMTEHMSKHVRNILARDVEVGMCLIIKHNGLDVMAEVRSTIGDPGKVAEIYLSWFSYGPFGEFLERHRAIVKSLTDTVTVVERNLVEVFV